MSDSDYHSMKRGLVGALNPVSRIPFNAMDRDSWMQTLFSPLDAKSNAPTWWEITIIWFLNMFASLFHGWVTLAIWGQLGVAVGPATYLQNFVVGITAAGAYAISASWTYDERLPTLVIWEIAPCLAIVGQLGYITAIFFYGLASIGGYVVAGAIVMSLGVAPGSEVINIASGGASYAMYFFGSFVVVFAYVFNHLYRIDGENDKHNHRRKVSATTKALFVMTVVCAAFGVVTLTGGQYLASLVVRSGNPGANASVGEINAVAWFICVPMLMVPAAVMVIAVALWGIRRLAGLRVSETYTAVVEVEPSGNDMNTQARLQVRQGTSSKLVNRKVQVNY